MSLFSEEVVVFDRQWLISESVTPRQTTHPNWMVSRKKFIQKMMDLSFPGCHGHTKQSATVGACMVFALESVRDRPENLKSDPVSPRAKVYDELAFFGDSSICLRHALASSGLAKNIIVIGTRSREHVTRMADHYWQRLYAEASIPQS
ncbi:hypothetical protein [Undibacterium fentianense]|uniref:Uncharacterized protein n=1 Tax=Undibacterium fentianense TaxID=2828728 RepID=A0A941E6C0_9BURK|nr:hypothetical protein [Undibacterium fentianense]MBR7799538.1 hypothetical protein [Undibacterium fentianense]